MATAFASSAFAQYEAPLPAYAPGTYYDTINPASPGTLKTQLNTRTGSGLTMRTYDAFDSYYFTTDGVSGTTNRISLIYTREVVPTNDSGVNKEHQWVDSRLPSGAPNNDYFNLRPCDIGVNSNRGNLNFTSVSTTTGANGIVNVGGVNYYFPGNADKGDTARSLFYMAMRYTNLTLVNGNPLTSNVNEMGDLASLLKNNYTDGVDNYERKRNAGVFSVQNNRNPFVDHPEYTWAVYGGGNNNSRLAVAPADASGASAATVNLGRVMQNGTLGTGSVTLSKTGANPTTFDITTVGSAVTAAATTGTVGVGIGQVIDYNAQSRGITVGLASGTTSSTGLKTGTVTINNTDLTTGGAGLGSADGNDVVTVQASVLSKRVVTPSTTSVNFGTVIRGAEVSSSFDLTTTGDDNSNTRVNVAGNSSASNGLQITGTTTQFNAATSTAQRTLSGTLSNVGVASGSLALAVTTAENNGTGLAGEGSYSSVNVAYSATVLDHSNASFSNSIDSNITVVDLGVFDIRDGPATVTLEDLIYNRSTTAGSTAGLDLDSILAAAGETGILSLTGLFTNLAENAAADLTAKIATDALGVFSATYTLGLSDQDLTGATAANSETITLTLTAAVVPEPAMLTLAGATGLALLRRRRAR
ncbi:MAG TPA: endonuclease [Tepidisphaeraceae bacterium]